MLRHKTKTRVLFRWTGRNMYTLSVLIGLLDERLDKRSFTIDTIEDLKDLNTLSLKERVILAYSFTSMIAERVKSEIAQIRKNFGDRITIICGGPHVTACPQEFINAGADVVFVGEGEGSLPHFIQEYHKTGILPKDRIIKPLPMKNFDDYPPFAYKRNFFAPVELRRGCHVRCTFCQTSGIFPEIRERSVEYVKRYMKYIMTSKRYNVFFLIPDALLYGSKTAYPDLFRLEHFLKEVSSTGVNIHLGNFPSEVSPGSLARYPEAAGILRKYVHNTKIIVGGQSGSNAVLRSMHRNHSAEDIVESVKILRANRFTPIVDILLGTPGETMQDRKETMRMIKDLYKTSHAQFNVHYFTPLPGTKLAGTLPEKIENTTLEEIKKMIEHGIVHGDFFRHYNV